MAERTQKPLGKIGLPRVDARTRTRLVALELRLGSLSYAVFEIPAKLMDWGVSRFSEQESPRSIAISNKIETLLSVHRPFAVVTRGRHYRSAARDGKFIAILRTIRSTASRHSTKVVVLSDRQVQRHFAPGGKATKHEIAEGMARQFEELSWKLPRRRKSYESEPRVMLAFDAVATGWAFLRRGLSPKENNG